MEVSFMIFILISFETSYTFEPHPYMLPWVP